MATPNFTGYWKVDLDRSQLRVPAPAEIVMKIVHVEPVFMQAARVTDAMGNVRRGRFEGRTGGEEFSAEIAGMPTQSRADWQGEELVVRSTIRMGESAFELADTWTISPGGDELVMEHREGMLAGQRTLLVRMPLAESVLS